MASFLRDSCPACGCDFQRSTASRTVRSGGRRRGMDGQLLPSARINRWLIEQGLVPSILGLWPVHLAFGLAATWNLYLLGRPAAELERTMRASNTNHQLPQWLGFSGLLPMSAFLTGLWFWPQLTDQLVFMAVLYVGAIFSFLGGIQWGLAVTTESLDNPQGPYGLRLVVGVTPSLITFVALVVPPIYGGLLLIAGLWLLLLFEWQRHASISLPAWYLPLRINLTVLLSGSLAAVFWLTS